MGFSMYAELKIFVCYGGTHLCNAFKRLRTEKWLVPKSFATCFIVRPKYLEHPNFVLNCIAAVWAEIIGASINRFFVQTQATITKHGRSSNVSAYY